MVIGIIGESCTGKSSLAEKLRKMAEAEVFTGKDYLRLARNEQEAADAFRSKLKDAVTGDSVIYVISEPEHLSFLPGDAVRIVMTAELSVIEKRFAERMHGILPQPVAERLAKKHGCFDRIPCDLHLEGEYEAEDVWAAICRAWKEKVKNA